MQRISSARKNQTLVASVTLTWLNLKAANLYWCNHVKKKFTNRNQFFACWIFIFICALPQTNIEVKQEIPKYLDSKTLIKTYFSWMGLNFFLIFSPILITAYSDRNKSYSASDNMLWGYVSSVLLWFQTRARNSWKAIFLVIWKGDYWVFCDFEEIPDMKWVKTMNCHNLPGHWAALC